MPTTSDTVFPNCNQHVCRPGWQCNCDFSAESLDTTTSSVTQWYCFKQLLFFHSIHPLLLSPAVVVRRLSSAACFCCNIHCPILLLAILSPPALVALSTALLSNLAPFATSRPRNNIAAAIIALTPCHLLLIARSCHIVRPLPPVLLGPPPCSNCSCDAIQPPAQQHCPHCCHRDVPMQSSQDADVDINIGIDCICLVLSTLGRAVLPNPWSSGATTTVPTLFPMLASTIAVIVVIFVLSLSSLPPRNYPQGG